MLCFPNTTKALTKELLLLRRQGLLEHVGKMLVEASLHLNSSSNLPLNELVQRDALTAAKDKQSPRLFFRSARLWYRYQSCPTDPMGDYISCRLTPAPKDYNPPKCSFEAYLCRRPNDASHYCPKAYGEAEETEPLRLL